MIINGSRWYSHSEGVSTLFSASTRPDSIIPGDCNTPSAFAWVLHNEATQEITAARDYLGLEPFYYFYQDGAFFFASSIPDLLKKLPLTPALNTNRLLEECFHEIDHGMVRYSNETHYQGIFRLDPGSKLHIQNGQLRTEVYWQFERGAPTIYYAKDEEYIEHFGELLNRVVLEQLHGHTQLAAEYSGGLDSSAMVAVCHQNNIRLPLFCHVAGDCLKGGDFSYAECVINEFKLDDVHYIDARHFDPAEQFQTLAALFGGAPPYLFFIMANNIYQAIAKQGKTRILSGFGGDQCVSTHAHGRPFYFELLRKGHYQRAWHELTCVSSEASRINILVQLLRHASPQLNNVLNKVGDVKSMIKSYLQNHEPLERFDFRKRYASTRELQVDMLEGDLCHEVRMRVEYSAVLGKTMGFSHAYPLLHPAVIDFALRLPIEQQRRNGEGRYLIRRYLAQYVPEKNYAQKKKDGAHIMPAVMKKCADYEASGNMDNVLQQLPFLTSLKKAATPHQQLRQKIYASMINYYAKTGAITLK
jgi:asparagine synthase (glutamine-hydrolysing)